jgi:hypothetical protein
MTVWGVRLVVQIALAMQVVPAHARTLRYNSSANRPEQFPDTGSLAVQIAVGINTGCPAPQV